MAAAAEHGPGRLSASFRKGMTTETSQAVGEIEVVPKGSERGESAEPAPISRDYRRILSSSPRRLFRESLSKDFADRMLVLHDSGVSVTARLAAAVLGALLILSSRSDGAWRLRRRQDHRARGARSS